MIHHLLSIAQLLSEANVTTQHAHMHSAQYSLIVTCDHREVTCDSQRLQNKTT